MDKLHFKYGQTLHQQFAREKRAFAGYVVPQGTFTEISSESEEFVIEDAFDENERDVEAMETKKRIREYFYPYLPTLCCWGLCYVSLKNGMLIICITYFLFGMADTLIVILGGEHHTTQLSLLFMFKIAVSIALILLELVTSGYAYLGYAKGDRSSLKFCLYIHLPHLVVLILASIVLYYSHKEESEDVGRSEYIVVLTLYSLSLIQIVIASIHIFAYRRNLKKKRKNRNTGHQKTRRYFELRKQ